MPPVSVKSSPVNVSLLQCFPSLKKLQLPSLSKLPFKSIDQKFLDKSKTQLNTFLQVNKQLLHLYFISLSPAVIQSQMLHFISTLLIITHKNQGAESQPISVYEMCELLIKYYTVTRSVILQSLCSQKLILLMITAVDDNVRCVCVSCVSVS